MWKSFVIFLVLLSSRGYFSEACGSAEGRGQRSKRSFDDYGFPLGDDVLSSQITTSQVIKVIDEFEYINCFESWINNTKNSCVGCQTIPFDENYEPSSCVAECKSKKMPLSLLKGGECDCKSIKDFKMRDISSNQCNLNCPISSLDPNLPAPPPDTACGGNRAYSVYCQDTDDEKCVDIDTGRHKLEKIKLFQAPEPFMKCAFCASTSNCLENHISPKYDYFPRNEALDCTFFCKEVIHYASTSGGTPGESILVDEIRPPTKYAVLMWDRGIKMSVSVPICRCMNEIVLFTEQDTSLCNTPCPGDPTQMCGAKTSSGGVYATIYCTQDGCQDPVTTTVAPTTTILTTTLTSTENDADCSASTTTRTTPSPPITGPGIISTSTSPDGSSPPTIPTTNTSDPTITSTSSTTTALPPNTKCSTKCEGREYSGREWSVCAGHVQEKDCDQENAKGHATWECSLDGQFVTEHPDYSLCHSDWLEELVGESDNVNDTASAVNYLDHLTTELNARPKYFGHEIEKFAVVLHKVVNMAGETTQNSTKFEQVADKVVEVAGHFITTLEPWHQLKSEERSAISTNLLTTVEDTGLHLTSKVVLSDGDNDALLSYEKPLSPSTASHYFVVAGAISKTSNRETNTSLEFPSLQSSTKFPQDSFIKLPHGWKNLIEGSNSHKIQYVGLLMDSKHANLMMPGQFSSLGLSESQSKSNGENKNQDKTVVNGKLMSFTVASDEPSGKVRLLTKDDPRRLSIRFPGKGVEITFKHDLQAWGDSAKSLRRKLHAGETPTAALGTAKCVYWDTQKLEWSTKGCKTVESSRHQTVCECSHLTSFAILMDVHQYLGKDIGLEILTLLLCSFSFICLFISVTVFATFHGIQSERNSITKNLAICLLIGNTLVMLVLDRNYFNMSDGFCVASGILTHYVFLAAFAWMAVEGVHLYRMVVHVFDSENNPLNMYRAISYGIPLIVVIITAVVGYLKGDQPYGGDVVCWLDGSYIWSFLVPVCLIVLGNLIILFIALKTAYQVQYSSKRKLPTIQSRVRSFRIWLRGCLSLTVLLGVTWLVGFFTLVPDTPGIVAAYIFTILNGSQGIFIFIFHCVYNEKIRLMTYQRFGNYLPTWLSSSLYSTTGSNYPSDAGKREESQMKHSSFDSSINKQQSPSHKHSSETNPANEKNTNTSPKTDNVKVSVISDSYQQIVNRRGSLKRQQSFGSVDSVRGSGSLSDSSAGGSTTDNSRKAFFP